MTRTSDDQELPEGVTKNDTSPATAMLGDLVRNHGGSKKEPDGANKKASTDGSLAVTLPGATRRAKRESADEMKKRLVVLSERSAAFTATLAAIPGDVLSIFEDLRPKYAVINTQLAQKGVSYDEKQRLFVERDKLDAEFKAYFDVSFPNNFNGTEKEQVSLRAKVAYFICRVLNCPAHMAVLEKLVHKGVELGVLTTKVGEDDAYAWVGRSKYALAKGVRSEEKTIRENTPEFSEFPGIISALIGLAKPAKAARDEHIKGVLVKLFDGVTEGATVEDLIAPDGGEVMLVVEDPGETVGDKEHRGGRIRVFRSADGLISPKAVMGGNARKVEELMEQGVAVEVAMLGSEKPQGLGREEWILHKILRRAVAREQTRLANRKKGEEKFATDMQEGEDRAKHFSVNEDVPLISISEFHNGGIGVTTDGYKGCWNWAATETDGKKGDKKPYFHPVYVVERLQESDQTKVVVRWANESAMDCFKAESYDIVGVVFPEFGENPNEAYGGVFAPARQLLQVSHRREMDEKNENEPVGTSSEAEALAEKPKPAKKAKAKKSGKKTATAGA